MHHTCIYVYAYIGMYFKNKTLKNDTFTLFSSCDSQSDFNQYNNIPFLGSMINSSTFIWWHWTGPEESNMEKSTFFCEITALPHLTLYTLHMGEKIAWHIFIWVPYYFTEDGFLYYSMNFFLLSEFILL